MYIDTHAHLYEEEFREDRAAAIQRAKEAGIAYIILPDIDSESRGRMLELEAEYPEILFPLVGVHPTSIGEDYKQELAEVEKWLGIHKFYGIGECGIDLYWDKTFYKEQEKAFEHQLGIARDAHLPVIIHSRESLPEIFRSLEKFPYVTGILHCFPGTPEEAKKACDMGFLLGIGGVVTFKKSQMAEVVRTIGPDHLVLETDAPYLSPVPNRGKRNESSYLPLVAAEVARLSGHDQQTIEEITTRNAINLFSLSV